MTWYDSGRPIWLARFVAGYLLIALVRLSIAGDYTVTRGTTIHSERPIGLLILEMGLGVLNGRNGTTGIRPLVEAGEDEIAPRPAAGRTSAPDNEPRPGLDVHAGGSGVRAAEVVEETVEGVPHVDRIRLDSFPTGVGAKIGGSRLSTRLWVDGREQSGRTSALAAWRLAGFLLWDADGSIERTTTPSVRGHVVHIHDTVRNGMVCVRVVVGPPLGDPRVRCAVLELSALENENGTDERSDWIKRSTRHLLARCGLWPVEQAGGVDAGGTRIQLTCSAIIDLPCDRRRERVHARRKRILATGCCGRGSRATLSERIAQREAGPELSSRVDGLTEAGRAAVLSGRGRLTDGVIAEFLERVCE